MAAGTDVAIVDAEIYEMQARAILRAVGSA
jgi:hypothetical protein